MKLHLLSLVALHAVAADTYDDIVARCAKTVEEAGITPDECSTPGPPGLRPGQLAGRLVVITGASRGVGAELARTFASEGAMVVVNYYKSKDKAEAVVAEINRHLPQALAVYGDVRVKADMDALVAKAEAHFGAKVSVLVNNALQSYQFDPTSASASLKTVEWESIDAQMKGTVQGAVNDRPEHIGGRRADDAVRRVVLPY